MKRCRKFSLPRCNTIGPEPPFAVTFTSSGSERSTSSRLREYCAFACAPPSPPSSSRISRMKVFMRGARVESGSLSFIPRITGNE